MLSPAAHWRRPELRLCTHCCEGVPVAGCLCPPHLQPLTVPPLSPVPALQAERIGGACSELAVKPPAAYALRPTAALYQAIVQTAQQPELAIPETPSLKVCEEEVAGAGWALWV